MGAITWRPNLLYYKPQTLCQATKLSRRTMIGMRRGFEARLFPNFREALLQGEFLTLYNRDDLLLSLQ